VSGDVARGQPDGPAERDHDMRGVLADPPSAGQRLGSGGGDRGDPVRVADRLMHVRAKPVGGCQPVLVGHRCCQLPDCGVGGGEPGRAQQP
jgi:hypothetical protein